MRKGLEITMGRIDSFLLWVERKARHLRKVRIRVRSQYYWSFDCMSCGSSFCVLKENLPDSVISGESRFLCNDCGSLCSKPSHQLEDFEVCR